MDCYFFLYNWIHLKTCRTSTFQFYSLFCESVECFKILYPFCSKDDSFSVHRMLCTMNISRNMYSHVTDLMLCTMNISRNMFSHVTDLKLLVLQTPDKAELHATKNLSGPLSSKLRFLSYNSNLVRLDQFMFFAPSITTKGMGLRDYHNFWGLK